MRVSDLFDLEDFMSKDGGNFTQEALDNIPLVAEQLDYISSHFGKKVEINSAFRTEAHNKKIGGEKNSYHLKGMAVDIWIDGVAPRVLKGQLEMMMNAGKILKGGVGLYDTFVHYDIRGFYASWDKRKNKTT